MQCIIEKKNITLINKSCEKWIYSICSFLKKNVGNRIFHSSWYIAKIYFHKLLVSSFFNHIIKWCNKFLSFHIFQAQSYQNTAAMATRNKKRRHLSVASNDGTSPKKTKTAMMTSLECPGNFFLQNLFKKISYHFCNFAQNVWIKSFQNNLLAWFYQTDFLKTPGVYLARVLWEPAILKNRLLAFAIFEHFSSVEKIAGAK